MSAQNARPNDENRPIDKYSAIRDPGATPRRSLKNNNIAVVHSSDLDSEPNTEMYEAYEEEEKSAAPQDSEGNEQAHKTVP